MLTASEGKEKEKDKTKDKKAACAKLLAEFKEFKRSRAAKGDEDGDAF